MLLLFDTALQEVEGEPDETDAGLGYSFFVFPFVLPFSSFSGLVLLPDVPVGEVGVYLLAGLVVTSRPVPDLTCFKDEPIAISESKINVRRSLVII
jgi:hypothetical protein